MSPCAPSVPGARVTSCPSASGACVTSCSCPWGPCHLVPLNPRGLCHLVPLCPGSVSPRAPTFIALDTDLLVGSLLYTPIAPPLGLGAGGRPPAPCEGRRGSPSRESTRVPHLVTPASRLGFSGAGGTLALGLSPGWTQASQGHMAGHAGPCARWPPTCPLPPLEVRGPELVYRGHWHFARLHLMFRPGLSGFSTATLFSRCLTSFLWGLWRTTVTQALLLGGGLCAPLSSLPLGLGPRMDLGVPQLMPQGQQCLLHSPFLEPWGSGWASPQLGSSVRPRPVSWSLCKGCPGRLHGQQGGH